MTSGRTAGLVFLALALIALAGRLGLLDLISVVFLALGIMGGAIVVFSIAFQTYRGGRAEHET